MASCSKKTRKEQWETSISLVAKRRCSNRNVKKGDMKADKGDNNLARRRIEHSTEMSTQPRRL